MKPCVIGIDLGTSSVKAIQLGLDGEITKARVQYSGNGCSFWYAAVVTALQRFNLRGAVAVGLTGQVGTYVVDGKTVIGWEEAVGNEELQELLAHFDREFFIREIGMPHPGLISYPVPRLRYITRHFPKVKCVFQPKDDLYRKLTGILVTDPCSMRGLANPHTGKYSRRLVSYLGIDESVLPPLCGVTQAAGNVTAAAAEETGLPLGIPVYCGCNDFFASVLGTGIKREDELFDITGTSEHFGKLTPLLDPDTSLVCGPYLEGFVHYGVTASSGVSIEFGMRHFGFDGISLERMIRTKPPVFLPYLNGERAPIWDSDARGVFFGIQADTDRDSMGYSVLEGIVFSLFQIYEKLDCPEIKKIIISGGAAGNQTLNRMKASLFGVPVIQRKESDTSALGAALLALSGTNLSESLPQEATKGPDTDPVTEPEAALHDFLQKRYRIYRELYPSLKQSFKDFGRI